MTTGNWKLEIGARGAWAVLLVMAWALWLGCWPAAAQSRYPGGVLTDRTAGETLATQRVVVPGTYPAVAYPDYLWQRPLGVTRASASSAANVLVDLLGAGDGVSLVAASGTLTAGYLVTYAEPWTGGQVAVLPSDVGLYWTFGRALATVTDGTAMVATQPPRVTAVAYAMLADSDTLSDTTDPTALVSLTANGATLTAGDVLEVTLRGTVGSVNATPEFTVTVGVHTATVATIGGAVVAGDTWQATVRIVLAAAGASGSIRASGVGILGTPGTATPEVITLDTTALDLSGDVTITVNGTWSAAHADNQATLTACEVRPYRGGQATQ